MISPRTILGGIIIAFWLQSCTDTNTPPLSGGDSVDVPVASLQFFPLRKYFTQGDSTTLKATGMRYGFQCARLTDFDFKAAGPRSWSLGIKVAWPETFDECPMDATGGRDTTFRRIFSSSDLEPYVHRLLNSSGQTTDSASLTEHPHIKKTVIFSGLDSDLLGDSSLQLFPDVIDTLNGIACGDSISLGVYCVPPQSDSVRLDVYTTRGWSASDCDSLYAQPLENHGDYFTRIKPNSATCENLLESFSL